MSDCEQHHCSREVRKGTILQAKDLPIICRTVKKDHSCETFCSVADFMLIFFFGHNISFLLNVLTFPKKCYCQLTEALICLPQSSQGIRSPS